MIALTIRSSTRLKPFLHRLHYLVQDHTSHVPHPAPDTACLRRRGVGGAESYIIHPATNIVHPASGIQHPTTFDQLTTRRRQP